MNRRHLKQLSPLFALAIFLFALWALNRALGDYRFDDILRQLQDFPPGRIAMAAALTVVTYLVLTLYDRFALRYLGRTLPAGRVILASYTSYAFSRNIGLSLLTGGSIRYRLYSPLGLSAADVARLTAFAALSFALGLAAMAGGLLLLSPATLPELPGLPPGLLRSVGAVALAATAGYLLLAGRRRHPFRWRNWQFSLPPARLALAQLLVGAADWTLTASVLYLLLPPSAELALPQFLQAYLLAQLAVMVSHVPGGLGVFESVILLLVPGLPAPVLFGSLLVYRALYFLFPFGVAILLLGTFETLHRHGLIRRAGAGIGQWLSAAAPTLLAAGVLFAGALLLFSGGTPPLPEHIRLLRDWLPPPLMEAAHFSAALIAAGLFLVAPGLQRRLRAAHLTALVLLSAGASLALLKGLQLGTAAVLGLVLTGQVSARGHFDQQGGILEDPPPIGWLAAMLIAFSLSAWLGLFVFRPQEVLPATRPSFAVAGDFPRFLRAETGAALLFLTALLAGRRRPERLRLPGEKETRQAAKILSLHGSPLGPRLLGGDLYLLFSEAGEAFLSFGITPRSRIALGDPVGPAAQQRELAGRFQRLCERTGAWPAFHQVTEENRQLYLDLGLALQTVGERGKVDLVAGKRRDRRIRPIWRPEIVPDAAAAVPLLAGNLPAGTPAVVLRLGKEVVGLAPFWADQARRELIPLRLLNQGGGQEILEELLLALADWGRGAGFLRLDLGLTPLAAGSDLLDPLWSRIGARLYPHAEHFVSLAALRRFKENLQPVWETSYIACPSAIEVPLILEEISTLET